MQKRFASLLGVTMLFLASCSTSLAGGGSSAVGFSDMSPAPRAAVSGNWLTVYLGVDSRNSLAWVHTNVKITGHTVCITGRRTGRIASKQLSVTLPETALTSALEVYWVNPDGSRTAIPVQPEPPQGITTAAR